MEALQYAVWLTGGVGAGRLQETVSADCCNRKCRAEKPTAVGCDGKGEEHEAHPQHPTSVFSPGRQASAW